MKVLREFWRLWAGYGDCTKDHEDFNDAKGAYIASGQALKDNRFMLLERHTITDESELVEAIVKAGIV